MSSEQPTDFLSDFRVGAPEYAPLLDVLERASRGELSARQKRLKRAVAELGLQFSDEGRRSAANQWDLDLTPVIFEPDVWKRIETGVVEHHMGTPFGLSHVLQNRRILSEVFPELFEAVDAAPVATFSTYLLEMLRAQSDKINPHVLLLTGGCPGRPTLKKR